MKLLFLALASCTILVMPAGAETSGVPINCASAADCSTKITFSSNGVPVRGGSAYIKHINCSWTNDSVYRIELEVSRDDTKAILDQYQFVLNQDERAAGAMSGDTAYEMYVVNGFHVPVVNFYARNNGPLQGSCFVQWHAPIMATKPKG